MKKKTRTALVLVILIVAGAGMGYAVMDEPYGAGPTITYDASDTGPSVELGEGASLSAERPFPDSQTVDLYPYGTISSDGRTTMRIGDPSSDFVTLSQINTNGNTITADYVEQTGVEFDGSVNTLSVSQVNTQSEQVDLTHDGDVTLTLLLDESGKYVAKDTTTGAVLDADSGANPTFSLVGTNDVTIVESSGAPTVSNPSPTDAVSTKDVTLQADVEDPDGGQVSVDLLYEGSVIESQTIDGNGTISADPTGVTAGSNNWSVEATNQFGETTVESYTFGTPSTLEIRNETAPGTIVNTSADIEVTFIADDQLITRTTSDGTIDMEGLPIETFVVEVEADGYVTRQAVIGSIVEQQDVYLLPDTATAVRPEFVIDDTTGQFAADQTRVLIERPITRNGATNYEVVAGDDYGASGFSTTLEADQRYRVVVENTDTGARQSLGPYTATNSERVTLQVDTIDFNFDDAGVGYQWGAQYVNATDSAPKVEFGFDAEHGIDQLTVEIRQRGGDETIVLSETHSDVETVGEVADLGQIDEPDAQTYVVEWSGVVYDGDGNTQEVSGSNVVGSDQMPVSIPGVGDDVMQVVGVLLLFMISGLFSAANVEVGAIVLSIMAGGMWFAGLLPGIASGLLIGTALMVSILWMVKDRRGEQ